tara:strand:+ start:330 stop:452 length:123 start_codon:yes stop_codon:yes gene_type:complete
MCLFWVKIALPVLMVPLLFELLEQWFQINTENECSYLEFI